MKTQVNKKLSRALISVYDKEAARGLIKELHDSGVSIISTGGTLSYIKQMGIPATPVEDITGYPEILGGRVKTLHPAIMGAILCRPGLESDNADTDRMGIKALDMVVVDLYPFEETIAAGADHDEIIEKIDIGGISLIRAAAKNFSHVLVIPSKQYYSYAENLIGENKGLVSLDDRKRMAAAAMEVTSHYDTAIFGYLNQGHINAFKKSINQGLELRYGENPHQQARFYGDLDGAFEQLGGKPLSYNNLLDVDAAMGLISEFRNPAMAVIKHGSACGAAERENMMDAWTAALSGDPVSAFGGVIVANREVDGATAGEISNIFFEVLIAPAFSPDALEILARKKNRIILRSVPSEPQGDQFRTALNGVLWQSRDDRNSRPDQWNYTTVEKPGKNQKGDLLFANTIVKHLKSNAIALAKNNTLIGIGTGQTSRVDALKQAIVKAREFGHDLKGAVMASDAFFPFADCVEIAHKEGIAAVIQPGGSVRDQDSVDYCNSAGMSMVFTGIRHFKH